MIRPRPMRETARITCEGVSPDIHVFDDDSGQVASVEELKGALEGLKNEIDDDALSILCDLNDPEVRKVRKYMHEAIEKWFPVFNEDKNDG